MRLVEDDLARVEEVFRAQVRSDVRLVGEIGRYIQEGGGKRVRPALLLLASRLCGYRGERAVTLASTVEFIHTASLLHDDIIDEATTRRGRRSVNSRWGNDITVLLGDFLYTKSMAMALSQDNLRILRLLSDVTLRLIEGEILEIERNGDLRVTEEDHLDTIRRKTADLFAACTRIGAILGERGRGARAGARELRPQPRPLLPDGGRPPRLHRRGEDARQAGGERPPRGQGHPAHDLPAPAGREGGGGEGQGRPRRPRASRA